MQEVGAKVSVLGRDVLQNNIGETVEEVYDCIW